MIESITDTYAAAVSNDLADVGDATLVGVVRQPPWWFHGIVDDTHSALGPPADLIDAVRERREALSAREMCDEGAHSAACEELDFRSRYQHHLDEDVDAQARLASGGVSQYREDKA